MSGHNPAPRPYRRGGTVHEMFGWCARRWPGAVALVHGDRRVTYAELDAASDDYAVALDAEGVGPGRLVPVLMPRTPEFIAVLLAVLKRGAAYAALDRGWPAGRLRDLITRLDGPVVVTTDVVTTGDQAWPLPSWRPPADVCAAAAAHRRPEPVSVGPRDPSVVYFTSGTTGAPKGVVSPHAGTVRLFDECAFAPLGPGSVLAQAAPPQWDGFVLDLWGPLLTGGTSVLVDEPIVPRTLRELVARDGVNGAFLTTALFNMIVDEDSGAFEGVGWVLIGGERVSPAHIRRFLRRHPGATLHNMYGPVECGVVVTAHDVRPTDCDDPDGVPLGRVLGNTEVHLMDGDRVCADGEAGELCLGGDGLALGYLGDPELTTRAFPQVTVDGVTRRVYRTGDLGHWAADGTLRFGGRADRQVKIRGHRIEPAEIERNAESVPGVTGAAVLPVRGPGGACKDLVLYYDGSGAEETVRKELERRVPEYLVPGRIRRLRALPRLANGKLDHRALERLTRPADAPAGGAEPVTAGEKAVARLVGEVLAAPSVPRDVPVFALGADSLDAARLCARIDAEFGVPIPVSQVFRTPTVAGLAGWLAGVEAGAGRPAPAVSGGVPLTPQQRAHLDDPANLCRLVWRVGGELDVAALAAAVGDVHRRHEALHARYGAAGEPVAVPAADPGHPEFVRLPGYPDPQAALTDVLFRPLDISAGRVWRAVVTGEGDRTLVGVAVHHVAFDGAAESVLAADLGTAYRARRAGRAPDFGGPAASLADLAAAYHRGVALADTTAQLAYWETELAGLTEAAFPGRLTSEEAAGPKHRATRTVDAAALAPWEEYVRGHGTTRLVYLAAAYARVLHTLTGQGDVAMVVPTARRGGPAGVTCRVDSLCLRARAGDSLDTARDTVGRALAAQDVPFAEVAQSLFMAGDGAALLSAPMLLYQDDPPPSLDLPGCTAELVRPDTPTTSAELEADVRPAGDALTITVTVRTDRLPARYADEVAAGIGRVLAAGPAPLLSRR
ncbi:amino acid adenylation domain-containing protein [Actinoallomurus sp. CA-150999]|uniref:amino acid adenylation domain-containing protein n=1 Tax=Actinoallomurus sp. CA-150999 TaxID=3239887 RepID=UPI003D907377